MSDTHFTFELQPMDTVPPEAYQQPLYIHEGCTAVVYGTNAKPIGWIDTHALFAGRVYLDHVIAETPIRLTDPAFILAGIRQFGLAPDGSDLSDLEAAMARRDAEILALREALEAVSGWMLQAAAPPDIADLIERLERGGYSTWDVDAEKTVMADAAAALRRLTAETADAEVMDVANIIFDNSANSCQHAARAAISAFRKGRGM